MGKIADLCAFLCISSEIWSNFPVYVEIVKSMLQKVKFYKFCYSGEIFRYMSKFLYLSRYIPQVTNLSIHLDNDFCTCNDSAKARNPNFKLKVYQYSPSGILCRVLFFSLLSHCLFKLPRKMMYFRRWLLQRENGVSKCIDGF